MTPTDDFRGETPANDSKQLEKDRADPPVHAVGPESETRGGPEAPDDSLAEGNQAAPTPTVPPPNRRLGVRAALPPGSLPKPYAGPQGDENREPPPDAPSPTGPADTV